MHEDHVGALFLKTDSEYLPTELGEGARHIG